MIVKEVMIGENACADMLLEACCGELKAFCGYLRSDPYKYGSVRDLRLFVSPFAPPTPSRLARWRR